MLRSIEKIASRALLTPKDATQAVTDFKKCVLKSNTRKAEWGEFYNKHALHSAGRLNRNIANIRKDTWLSEHTIHIIATLSGIGLHAPSSLWSTAERQYGGMSYTQRVELLLAEDSVERRAVLEEDPKGISWELCVRVYTKLNEADLPNVFREHAKQMLERHLRSAPRHLRLTPRVLQMSDVQDVALRNVKHLSTENLCLLLQSVHDNGGAAAAPLVPLLDKVLRECSKDAYICIQAFTPYIDVASKNSSLHCDAFITILKQKTPKQWNETLVTHFKCVDSLVVKLLKGMRVGSVELDVAARTVLRVLLKATDIATRRLRSKAMVLCIEANVAVPLVWREVRQYTAVEDLYIAANVMQACNLLREQPKFSIEDIPEEVRLNGRTAKAARHSIRFALTHAALHNILSKGVRHRCLLEFLLSFRTDLIELPHLVRILASLSATTPHIPHGKGQEVAMKLQKRIHALRGHISHTDMIAMLYSIATLGTPWRAFFLVEVTRIHTLHQDTQLLTTLPWDIVAQLPTAIARCGIKVTDQDPVIKKIVFAADAVLTASMLRADPATAVVQQCVISYADLKYRSRLMYELASARMLLEKTLDATLCVRTLQSYALQKETGHRENMEVVGVYTMQYVSSLAADSLVQLAWAALALRLESRHDIIEAVVAEFRSHPKKVKAIKRAHTYTSLLQTVARSSVSNDFVQKLLTNGTMTLRGWNTPGAVGALFMSSYLVNAELSEVHTSVLSGVSAKDVAAMRPGDITAVFCTMVSQRMRDVELQMRVSEMLLARLCERHVSIPLRAPLCVKIMRACVMASHIPANTFFSTVGRTIADNGSVWELSGIEAFDMLSAYATKSLRSPRLHLQLCVKLRGADLSSAQAVDVLHAASTLRLNDSKQAAQLRHFVSQMVSKDTLPPEELQRYNTAMHSPQHLHDAPFSENRVLDV